MNIVEIEIEIKYKRILNKKIIIDYRKMKYPWNEWIFFKKK